MVYFCDLIIGYTKYIAKIQNILYLIFMKNILICWIGFTDLKASKQENGVGLGPICQATKHFLYDEIVLISDRPPKETQEYIKWLKTQCDAGIVSHTVDLLSPTHFGSIYENATRVILETKERFSADEIKLSYHLSPGTPAMAAVWIIIAKTRHPATLIESSKKEGVKIASIPFDISAEFIPDLLRGPDERLEKLAESLPPEAPEFNNIIHRCQSMSRVITKARVIAPRSISTIIEGESGTGKELLARAIHNASPRKNKPFVALNCGAIPTELIESELFGHEKGSFTGADRKKIGYFEAANKGTIFLDEIGELPVAAQVKLLRAIQEKAIVRIGSTKPVEIDVRIIAATNRNLIDEIAAGKFRSDFFYRIAVAVLKLPPLRERKGDIGLLIDGLLKRINDESVDEPGYEHKKLYASAKNILINHSWPGNVRELQNTLRRAAIWSADATIDVDDVREAILPVGIERQDDLLDRPLGDGFKISKLMETLAKHYLDRALNEAAGNKSKAAKLIGLPNYQTFSNWMKKYDVK